MAAFPNIPAPMATMCLYATMLSDFPDEVVRVATMHIISRHKYNSWPTIAELRDACIDIQTGASRFPSAYDAFETVIAAIQKYGHYRYPQHVFESNPLIEKTIKAIGGWSYLCMSEDLVADRSRFIQAYEKYFTAAVDETRMLPEVRALTLQLTAGTHRLLSKPKE